LEARLARPAFAPLRPWLARLADPLQAGVDELNALAEEANIRVASGRPLRFVPPAGAGARYGEYEIRVYETGCVETRPGNRHDFFNALAWLAFPHSKAALNARHAAEIPREEGRRGRLRDLLTILDEGGVIVACDDPALLALLRERRWKELFWQNRARVRASLRAHVLGHAALEQALEPWPGITCKALVVPPGVDPDRAAADWLAALPPETTPRDLPPLPVFGLPGWSPENEAAEFYDDTRYFRPRAA
jgi:hypothetical protein